MDLGLDGRVALVRVHDVDPAPVPALHVDDPRADLVEPRDDETAAQRAEAHGETLAGFAVDRFGARRLLLAQFAMCSAARNASA